MTAVLIVALIVASLAFSWAILTRRLSVRLLVQRGIESDATRSRLADIVEHSNDPIVAKDANGQITAWNVAATRLYGYSASEAIGASASLIIPKDRGREESQILARVLAGETVEHYETTRRCRDGSIVEMSLTVSPLYGSGARPVGASVIGRDVSERTRATARSAFLSEASRRLAATLDPVASADALGQLAVPHIGCVCAVDVVRTDGDLELFTVVQLDAAGGATTWPEPRRAAEPTSRLVRDVLDSMQPRLFPCWESTGHRSMLRTPAPRSLAVLPLITRGRAIGVVSVGFARPYDEHDLELLRALAARAAEAIENGRLFRDAQAARALAEHAGIELAHAQERFRVAFEEAPIGVALISMRPAEAGRFLQVNPALCRLTGHSADELERRTVGSLGYPGEHAVAAESPDNDGERHEELRYAHADGHPIWVQIHAKLVCMPNGSPLYSVSHFQDVTEQKRNEERLHHLANHDALTGLFNRRRLEEELERVANELARYDEPASLLVIDLDNFKYINDTYGHAVGDDVIALAAAVLQHQSRSSDLVARIGGDEFAIVLAHTDLAGAETHARTLLEALRSNPLTIDIDRPLYVTASIGIASVGAALCELSSAQLLVEADIAMYDAKEAGRDRVCHVDVQADRSGWLRARLAWSQRIREALEHDRFELWEQPIVTVASGATDRLEILLRMLDDDDQPVAPGTFLDIAEHFGQIQAIDRWVVDRSIDLLAAHHAAGSDLHLEVNLSGATITDAEVIDFIVERVRAAPIDPRHLTFEVTETSAIINIDRARQFAHQLADLGCQFALDDFGSGFGSFYYLKHLPFDLIKIDGDFIRNLPESKPDQLTVRAIVQIAKGLGKETVAEFVGDEATMGLLRRYRVDYAQGYHLGRPRPATPPGILIPTGTR